MRQELCLLSCQSSFLPSVVGGGGLLLALPLLSLPSSLLLVAIAGLSATFCGDSVCNKLTRQGTVQMAARLSPFLGPLIPDQYSWKQRSTCSSARACHTPAVPAPLPAVPESRRACRRVPGPSDSLSSESTVPTLLRLLRSLLLRLCVPACCT